MADPIEQLAHTVFRRSPDVAHDLRTPLNIVVLNVELLRMRLRTLSEEVAEDPKIREHCTALERESRRISAVADAFLSVARLPEDEPEAVDMAALLEAELREASFAVTAPGSPCLVTTYRSRLEKAVQLISRGLSALLDPKGVEAKLAVDRSRLVATIEGPVRDKTAEFRKLFKFYYTDPSGEPDPSLASARLLLETFGGTIVAEESEGVARFTIELQGDE